MPSTTRPISPRVTLDMSRKTGLSPARGVTEKPAGTWTAEHVVDLMIPAMAQSDFYILRPDNDVAREVDEMPMLWALGDILENRPALSRQDPDYAERFKAFIPGQT